MAKNIKIRFFVLHTDETWVFDQSERARETELW